MSAWLDDIKDESKPGSHELKEQSEPKRKLKPRFSVNLSDADHIRVKKYCDDMGISCAALARTLILEKIAK